MKNIENLRNIKISYIRVFSTIIIVLAHTFTNAINVYNNNKIDYLFSNSFSNLSSICVLMFVMITGFLLLNVEKEYSVKDFFIKCIYRAVIPLLFFGTIYSMMEIYFIEKKIDLLKAITYVLSYKCWDHMWYLYMLIGVYLIMPLLKVFCNHATRKELEHILIILLVVDILIPSINVYLPFDIYRNLGLSYVVFYLLVGHYIQRYKPKTKQIYYIICILYVIYFIFFQIEFINIRFKTYNSLLLALSSISTFIILINIDYKERSFIRNIEKLCYMVYIIHPVFINFLFKYLKFVPTTYENSLIMLFVSFILVLLLSFITSFICSKFNRLKKFLF